MSARDEEARVGITPDSVKVRQFEIRIGKEVASFIKHGGSMEEAIMGIALAMGEMMEETEEEDIRNKFLVRTSSGRVSIGALLSRDMDRDDAVLLSAHLAVAAGDFGPIVMRRMIGIMRKEAKDAKR
jgi:hypothetical protein